MSIAASATAYKNQQILTASPEELTLMLYNGAIKFCTESIIALEKKDLEKSHAANLRAQQIVREFMATLDMQFDISHNLLMLYDYIEYRLIEGNIHKDAAHLEEAKVILVELRDTWAEAMKQMRLAKAVGR